MAQQEQVNSELAVRLQQQQLKRERDEAEKAKLNAVRNIVNQDHLTVAEGGAAKTRKPLTPMKSDPNIIMGAAAATDTPRPRRVRSSLAPPSVRNQKFFFDEVRSTEP